MKTRILGIGDAGQLSGFEQVFKGVLSYLHNTGNYDVVGYGIGYAGIPPQVKRYPFDVWPASANGDMFGVDNLANVCNDHKIDLIWTVQDMWNIMQYVVRKPFPVPMIAYIPVDTPNIRWSHSHSLGGIAQPVAYTNFGANELAAGVRKTVDLLVDGAVRKDESLDQRREHVSLPHPDTNLTLNLRLDYLSRWQNLDEWEIIPHGIDRTNFFPTNKEECRKAFHMDPDCFLVGNVSTNQFRKRLDTTIRMFAMLAAKDPKARLMLYCNGNNEHGLELHQVADYYGVHDKVYFVHDFVQEMDEASINLLYNACDVMVNSSSGEGWGLNSSYSAACGVPQMVPEWSSTREIWKDHALMIPALDYRMEHRHLNTCHAILDVKTGGEQLIKLRYDRDLREQYSKLALAKANGFLTWDQVGERFERVIRQVLGTNQPPAGMSLNQLYSARRGYVESELANVAYLENGKPVKLK